MGAAGESLRQAIVLLMHPRLQSDVHSLVMPTDPWRQRDLVDLGRRQ